jgi:hypothetical protein
MMKKYRAMNFIVAFCWISKSKREREKRRKSHNFQMLLSHIICESCTIAWCIYTSSSLLLYLLLLLLISWTIFFNECNVNNEKRMLTVNRIIEVRLDIDDILSSIILIDWYSIDPELYFLSHSQSHLNLYKHWILIEIF